MISELREQIAREAKAREQQVGELEAKLEQVLESNGEKRSMYEVETRCKILQDKNKTLFTEVTHLRREVDQKDADLEKA